MRAHPVLFNYLWIAPHVLQVALAVMMLRRKLAREFPAFFTYTVFEVFQFVVLYSLNRTDSVSGQQYADAWLLGNAVSIVLRFAIVSEIFSNVFRSYPSLQEFGKMVFQWATAVLMIVAVVLVAYASGNETDQVTVALNAVDRTASIVQCGLLVLLVLLSRFLSFSWRSYVFGIALGLGIFASVELGVSAVRAHTTGVVPVNDFLTMFTMGVYHCCVLFWIITLLLPERGASRVTVVPAHNLDRWNDALSRLLHQ
jgi:hypothetical protein